MPELERRLAGLAGLPVVPLPGAEAARWRGEQRTRRTRAALAGAGALVAVLALSAGAALGGGGPERIAPPPAHQEPSEVGLSASLLDAEDVAAVRPGEEWEVRATEDFPFDPLPAGCAEAVFGDSAETALRFLDGPETADGPTTVGHSLKAYTGAAEAQAAFQWVAASIRSCGEAAPGPQVVAGEPASTATRTYGTFAAGTRTVVFAVERIGAVLSGVAIRSFELDDIPPLADAAAAEVQGGAPPPRESEVVVVPGDAARGLLRPEDVATVEPGEWTAAPLTGDVLAPCGGGRVVPQLDDAGTSLSVRREAGGTVVDTQVFRFAEAADAALALDVYRTALGSCPSEPGRSDLPGSVTSYEIVEAPEGELLVRLVRSCDGCLPDISYTVVAQVADGLVVLSVAVGEDGGPTQELAESYAALAQDRLRAAG